VDEEAEILIGHVVALDILGDIYVIPIDDTLTDMRKHLQAELLGLPPAETSSNRARERSVREARKMTTVLPLWGRESSSMEPTATRDSPTEAVISLRKRRDALLALYRRLQAVRDTTNTTGLEETTIAARELLKACGHLIAEVEDPESLFNSSSVHGIPYGHQLHLIVDSVNIAIHDLEKDVSAKFDNNHSTKLRSKMFKELKRHDFGPSYAHLQTLKNLQTLKMQIDILLDATQLYAPGNLRTNSATSDALDDIKDKVDKIAARVSSRRSSSAEGNTAEGLWQMFYDELLNEGFSKLILDQNKVS
jgi:hypothetical protein